MVLKMCRNGDDCPFAHHTKELDVEYKPKEWVKIFNQNSQKNLRMIDGMASQSDFRKTLEFSKFRTTNSFLPTNLEEETIQIDKVVNTVMKLRIILTWIERKDFAN
jgi:hypothetical protein